MIMMIIATLIVMKKTEASQFHCLPPDGIIFVKDCGALYFQNNSCCDKTVLLTFLVVILKRYSHDNEQNEC